MNTIITCALTGDGDTLAKNPAVPVTPEEIAQSAIEAAAAGAAIVHIHVRDPVTTEGRRDLALYTDRTILYVPAKWPAASLPYDFSKSQINNTESYILALQWLTQLEVDGPGLYGSPPDITRANIAD